MNWSPLILAGAVVLTLIGAAAATALVLWALNHWE